MIGIRLFRCVFFDKFFFFQHNGFVVFLYFFFMKFKKAFSGLFVTLLISTSVAGCGSVSAPSAPDKPITMDYPTTKGNFDYFVENDSWETLAMSGPYYMGLQELDQPIFTQYDQLRSAKINEAQKLTADVYDSAVAAEAKLRDLKGNYLDFFDAALSSDPKLLPMAKAVAQSLIEGQLKYEGLKATYEGQSATSQNPVAQSFEGYQKTMVAVDLADAVNRDVAGFVASAAQITPILMASDNAGVASAAKAFDGKMDSISDLNGPLSAMQDNVGKLSTALKQLSTGEHFMGLGTLAYVAQELPALKEKAASLKPSANLKSDDIQFIQGYADAFGDFADGISTDLEKADASTLYLPPAKTGWIPGAYADGYFQSAMSTLSSAVSTAGKGLSMTWNGAKTAFGAAKTGAGYTLDATSAMVKSGFDIGFGLANGVSTDETAYQIRLNYKKVYDNYKKGTSGSEVLNNAGTMLEGAENVGQDVTKAVVEKVADTTKAATDQYIGKSETTDKIFETGKDWTSWGAGQLGKMTVGMFTGFGKGLYKVANTQATTGQTVEGMMDIGLSFIGGSKFILKGSQALKGGAQALKLLEEKGLNMAETAMANSELAEAKALAQEGVEKALGTEAEIAAKEALKADLEAASASISQRFADLLTKGGKTVFNNTLEGTTAYKEFVQDAFERSMGDYKKALLKVTGDNFKDYIDNLVASKADDLIKAVAADYAQKGIIPGFGGPFDGHYKGPVIIPESKGFTLPTDVQVTNGALEGKIAFSEPFLGKSTLKIDIGFTGDVDAQGVVTGQANGTASLTGDKESINAKIEGSISGKASSSDIDLDDITFKATCINPPEGVTCDGKSAKASALLNKLP
jgi:hypothetical protein